MSKPRCHISISLDGFVAGPNQGGRTRSARVASGCAIIIGLSSASTLLRLNVDDH